MRCEQREALLAAQLDQGRDEKPVEEALCARMSHEFLQRLRVRIARVLAQRQSALFEQPQHLREMAGFLARELRHRSRETGNVGKRREHRKRVRGCLLLAVRVIDEHLVESLDRKADPARRRLGQQLHGALVARTRGARQPRS